MPTAGSAYTYAYATLGELAAWIIGWDLVLEFALGAAVVARGWSAYLANLFDLPPSLFTEDAPVNVGAVVHRPRARAPSPSSASASRRGSPTCSSSVKVAICLFVIVAGAVLRRGRATSRRTSRRPSRAEAESGLAQPLVQALFGLSPTAFGIAGVLSAAAVVFFAYTGFEAVANLGEETRRPARDLPLGLLGTLVICALLYAGVSFVAHRDGRLPRARRGRADRRRPSTPSGCAWASSLISIAAVAGLTSVILVDLIAMTADQRTPWAATGCCRRRSPGCHPRFGTPVAHHRPSSPVVRRGPRRLRPAGGARRPGQHRHAVRLRRRVDRRARAAPHPPGAAALVPGAAVAGRCPRCPRWPAST